MIQGTGSNVGKSMLVAGLARAYVRRGLVVMPFKPQNMSNNAAVTADGGEIGRAQALQARAARAEPTVHMNPVLLKPETDTGAQVVVQGSHFATLNAREYGRQKHRLMPRVLDSFQRISASADLVLVEGAGSPAEINLRAGDIANMGFAQAASVPVVLVGDIDRGGVIAQLVGTHAVLPPADLNLIKGFIINKFRGDPDLFSDGLTQIKTRTGWPGLGVLPWFADAWRLPGEDAMDVTSTGDGPLRIAVPRLGRIANFDDLDPLAGEPGVSVQIIEPGRPLPGDAHLVLIPGSKSTIADLAAFRANGWDIDLSAHLRRGGHVLGICGGYQMLGQTISDPEGLEGAPATVPGLGLLNVTTVMGAHKRLARTRAIYLPTGTPLQGYEIHIGKTEGPDTTRGWLQIAGQHHGAASPNGRVRGCYLHGLFASDDFRHAFLAEMGGAPSHVNYEALVETTLDDLADHLEQHLDLDGILEISRAGAKP